GERGVVGIEEGAGDAVAIKDILDVGHHPPSRRLVGEDRSQVGGEVFVQFVVFVVVENPPPAFGLPVEVRVQIDQPVTRQRNGVVGGQGGGEIWCVRKLVAAQLLEKALA